ncbi:MAG: hypothetical protein ACC651_03405 [Candidatus Scalindua sp.]
MHFPRNQACYSGQLPC